MQVAVFYQSRYYPVKLHTILLAAVHGSQRAVEERAALTPIEGRLMSANHRLETDAQRARSSTGRYAFEAICH